MNNTVSEQIIAVIEALCDKLGVAIDWTSANILPYAQELMKRFIQYEIWTSVAWIAIVLVGVIVFYFVARKCKQLADEADWDIDEPISWAAIASIAVFIVFCISTLIVIPVQVFDIIEVLTIPEKTILEYLGLLKTQ
jgi:NADH:ubiquinone oxidoreductase subunit H